MFTSASQYCKIKNTKLLGPYLFMAKGKGDFNELTEDICVLNILSKYILLPT